ncbi:hypothetical protein GCM10027321_38200 [Massilia terrae]|uniref:EF-hand domain-containing protein n=1 Tax=Massilia terrae TaxID=1811224 RepID=A0ABT2D201_9BURK|nr:hypothetical protein [Massilia terrae]MCS0660253.1 hypothetical protein [Massilia terrae]
MKPGLQSDARKPAAAIALTTLLYMGVTAQAQAEQPPPPCHPNPNAAADVATVHNRGDVKFLPDALQDRLERMASRPHTYLPLQVYAEADKPSMLFQYYLLDTNGFEPNPFTTRFKGINDKAMLTATGGNCGLPTIAAIRLALEPKPGLPTDPNDIRAFIDVFSDLSNLFVINNESGWYEGWMIHDVEVPKLAAPRSDGHAQFGAITKADADALYAMGSHNNVPGHLFTMDGKAPRFPSPHDRFPDKQTNVLPIQLSMGAMNCLQQADCHGYWEFNYQTNWIFPLYELPFTGGIPGTFEAGKIGSLSSLIPGSGPSGVSNSPIDYGDDPNNAAPLGGAGPRDPDRFDADVDSQREYRQRFIPSGLANEVFLDTYLRLASFEPGVPFPKRLFDAYAAEVKRVDKNGDGVISAAEGDPDASSDGFADNTRLFLPATSFRRFAVTREINDGYLAPRFAPSQRAWVLSGNAVTVSPAVAASQGRDGDDR